MSQTYKILSFDGGGIRGLLTAKLLMSLEAELQKHNPSSVIGDYFDAFAGTSTGSFIACGIAQGLSAQAIYDFYIHQGPKIFPNMSLGFWLQEVLERVSRFRFSLPLFNPNGLEQVLRSPNIFPDDLLFRDLTKPTLITSYDTYNRKAIVFKSTDLKSAQIPVWQVCRASSAAPVAFPAYILNNEQFTREHLSGGSFEGDLDREMPPGGFPLIDGGIFANNPTLCAIAAAIGKNQKRSLDNILVVSFGTGQSANRITPNQATSWGAIDWSKLFRGIPLYQVCSDGAADVIGYITQCLVGEENYLRYQPVIDSKISTFQANESNLKLIEQEADNYLADKGNARLQELANRLINP